MHCFPKIILLGIVIFCLDGCSSRNHLQRINVTRTRKDVRFYRFRGGETVSVSLNDGVFEGEFSLYLSIDNEKSWNRLLKHNGQMDEVSIKLPKVDAANCYILLLGEGKKDGVIGKSYAFSILKRPFGDTPRIIRPIQESPKGESEGETREEK